MEEQFSLGRSTSTCNFVFKLFRQQLQVEVIYNDFNKDFDLVSQCFN